MTKENKESVICDLTRQQSKILKDITRIKKLPLPERSSTSVKRARKIIELSIKYAAIRSQILIISSQPIAPNFNNGCVVGSGSFKDGKELILNHKFITKK